MIKLKDLIKEAWASITSEYWILTDGSIIEAERESSGVGHDTVVVQYLQRYIIKRLGKDIFNHRDELQLKLKMYFRSNQKMIWIF